jgi:hypothetical protein
VVRSMTRGAGGGIPSEPPGGSTEDTSQDKPTPDGANAPMNASNDRSAVAAHSSTSTAQGSADASTAVSTMGARTGSRGARRQRARGSAAQWEEAKVAVRALFDAVGIKRIVWIDDQALIGAIPSITALVEELYGVDPKVVSRTFGGKELADDPDVRRQEITEIVERDAGDVRRIVSLLDEQRANLEREGRLVPRTEQELADAAHTSFSHGFRHLVEGYVLLDVKLPEEWEAEHAEIMHRSRGGAVDAPIDALPNTIVLFDLNLGPGREDAGRTLALQFLDQYAGFNPICGLISSSAPALDAREQWDDPSFGVDRLAFLSKQDLESAPIGFVAELKRVLQAPFARHVQEKLRGILSDASRHAADEVTKVSIADVVQTVRLSNLEGVPEIDTFRRIHDAFFRDELRRQAFGDVGFVTLLRRLREIGQIAPDAQLAPRLTTARYQRREMYDDPSQVNGLRMPVTVGDVFAFDIPAGSGTDAPIEASTANLAIAEEPSRRVGEDGDRAIETSPGTAHVERETLSYVLVTQQCHTVVRGNGKRRLRAATLARVRPPRTDELKVSESRAHLFVLPWFTDELESVVVDMSDTISVPFEVLDLCALNVDGRSELDSEMPPPDELLPGWRVYFDKLVARLTEITKVLRARLPAPSAPDHVVTILADPHGVSPVEMHFTASGAVRISYNCVRVGRVNEPYATGLLGQLGYYAAHDTFDVDMGRA